MSQSAVSCPQTYTICHISPFDLILTEYYTSQEPTDAIAAPDYTPILPALFDTFDNRYPSLTDLLDDVNRTAFQAGFAIFTRRSGGTHSSAELICWRSGPYRDRVEPGTRVREARSAKCDCTFHLHAYKLDTNTETWKFLLYNGNHNHPPSIQSAIPRVRCINHTLAATIRSLANAGTTAQRIQRYLNNKEIPIPLRARDINNLVFRPKRADRAGHSSAEALVAQLLERDELFRAFVNGRDRLVGILYTTPEARQLTRRFSNPLLMDCTYKTTRERLACLHIVGITASNSNFTSAVIWMLTETSDWYERALRAYLNIMGPIQVKVVLTDREEALAIGIKRVWDDRVAQIYCFWHIAKKIATKCKLGLPKKDYEDFLSDWTELIVNAVSHESMDKGVGMLRAKYSGRTQFDAIVSYVMDLLGSKEEYVHAWTDLHLHYSNRNTSRGEAAHNALKTSFGHSKGDLYSAIRTICSRLEVEYREVTAKMEQEVVRTCLRSASIFNAKRSFLESKDGGNASPTPRSMASSQSTRLPRRRSRCAWPRLTCFRGLHSQFPHVPAHTNAPWVLPALMRLSLSSRTMA